MSVLLTCCADSQPYLGIDPECSRTAVICLNHSSHTAPNGTIHNLIPISLLKQSINELKFHMGDKIASLTQSYTRFMDELIEEIIDLKMRKVIQMSTLWLRELSGSEEEYQQLKRFLRYDFVGMSCRDIFRLHSKLTSTAKSKSIAQTDIKELPAYSNIAKIMTILENNAKAKMLIVEKVTHLEGMLEKGELLKRGLPERKILGDKTKEILLQGDDNTAFEVRYNKAQLKKGGTKYQSLFSKYSLLPNTDYHLTCFSKYTNLLVGVCTEQLKSNPNRQKRSDLHYSEHSLTFNCSSGCLYRDGMFESGPSTLTKGVKELDLVLRVNQTEMFILLGKNIVCRTMLKGLANKGLYLHVCVRTQGDWIEIGREETGISEIQVHIESQQPLRIQEQPVRLEGSDVIQIDLMSNPSQQSVVLAKTRPNNDNILQKSNQIVDTISEDRYHPSPQDFVQELQRKDDIPPRRQIDEFITIRRKTEKPMDLSKRVTFGIQSTKEVRLSEGLMNSAAIQGDQLMPIHEEIKATNVSIGQKEPNFGVSAQKIYTRNSVVEQLFKPLGSNPAIVLSPQQNRPSTTRSRDLMYENSNQLSIPGNPNREQRSKIMISMRSSMLNSEYDNDLKSEHWNKQKLLSPAIITPLEKSQLGSELKSVNLQDIPSMRLTKKFSGVNGLRKTQMDSEWL